MYLSACKEISFYISLLLVVLHAHRPSTSRHKCLCQLMPRPGSCLYHHHDSCTTCKESDLAYNLFAIERTQEIYAYTWTWHVCLGLRGRGQWRS
jgi:hypothetical protein